MAIRYVDSIVTPFLFGLGPYVLIYILSTYPPYKTWVDTYPGSLISSGSCLLFIAVGYYILGNDPIRITEENTRWANRLPSYILPINIQITTTPSSISQNQNIPVPYIGVDIDALEAEEVDLPDRLFKHGGWRYTSILGIRTSDYLSPGNESLRIKLERRLISEGMTAEEVGKIWLLTRPRILEMRVNSPFSLWYIYDPLRVLKVVVLELHHKSASSETYILHSASSTNPTDTYSHKWTFPSTNPLTAFQSLKLEISDPFSTLHAQGGMDSIRACLTGHIGSSETSTQISLSPDIGPAKLKIHTMSDVWKVLAECMKVFVTSSLPAYSEVEARGETIRRNIMGFVDEPGRILDQTLARGVEMLRELMAWMGRGRGGLHTA